MNEATVSKIVFNKSKKGYMFDVPSYNTEGAINSYVLLNEEHSINLYKLEDCSEILENVRNIVSRSLHKKEYVEFLKKLKTYVEKYAYSKYIDKDDDNVVSSSIEEDDIISIAVHFHLTKRIERKKRSLINKVTNLM